MALKFRRGSYMTTFTGLHFYPGDPDIDMFCLIDIARGLSHENRANGHTVVPVSVAQHSVHVALVLRKLGYDVRTQFIGLMHDGSEAYLKDIPSPLKALLPDYQAIEEKVQALIYVWAGLGTVTEDEYLPIHVTDKALFPVEAKYFIPHANYEIAEELKDMVLEPWSPEQAREEFVKLYYDLRTQL